MENKIELKDVRLYKEDNKYYLFLKYMGEDISEKYEITIPKVELPLLNNELVIDTEPVGYGYYMARCNRYIRLDNNIALKIFAKNGVIYTRTPLCKKTRKMTLSEIEKKLGYKIEVISENEEKGNDKD